MSFAPDWHIIRELFRFGLPTGFQGIVMNLAGVLMLRFVGSLEQSAEAQAAYAVGYTQLFALITWTSVGLMSATAAVAGQNLGAGRPERSQRAPPSWRRRSGWAWRASSASRWSPCRGRCSACSAWPTGSSSSWAGSFWPTWPSPDSSSPWRSSIPAACRGTGDTRSPLYISMVSQVVIPIGLCTYLQMTGELEASGIWLAIVLGHVARASLSVMRFRQGKWRDIAVDIGPARA